MIALPTGLSVAAMAAVGAGLGVLLRGRLVTATYRTSEEGDDVRSTSRPRLWWVPVVVALVAAIVGTRDTDLAVTVTLVLGALWLSALVAIDLDVRRLPDVLTLPAIPAVGALLAWCSWSSDDGGPWWVAALCGAGSGLVYLVVVVLDPSGMGMGDVKLAVPLGMLTGWWGWAPTVLAFFLTFLIAAVWGVVAAVVSREGLRTTFAFGPSMALGSMLVLLVYA